jgi:hypothetical protein
MRARFVSMGPQAAPNPSALRALLVLATALILAGAAACSGGSSATTGDASDAGPARMNLEVILLDDQPDPFATLPPPLPKGLAPFQEAVVLGPENVELRTFVRLVVQPGETLPQALARAKPWLDARPLPPGDRLVFSEIREENEVTKVREAVGVRTFVATSKVILTQADVADASLGAVPDAQQKPQPVAMIQLTPEAGERFSTFTRENALRRIAVLIDGNVVMSARIEDEISGGKISIAMDPEVPYETKRAELERMVNGIKPKAPAAASSR